MKFTKGNLALRDHVKSGEDVHLFEEVPRKSGYLRYKGQMVCTGQDLVEAPDTKQDMRKAILFELVPIETFEADRDGSSTGNEAASDQVLSAETLSELRRKALADSAACRTPGERRSLYRLRSRAIRAYVLGRAAGACEGCGQAAPFLTRDGRPYLEPHHIRRLTDGGPDDPRWVAGLCPNCHRRAHYSNDGPEFNARLGVTVLSLEESVGRA